MNRIYITQYGYWWSATREQWIAFCKEQTKPNRPFNLNNTFKRLECRPKSVTEYKDIENTDPEYFKREFEILT